MVEIIIVIDFNMFKNLFKTGRKDVEKCIVFYKKNKIIIKNQKNVQTCSKHKDF